MIEKREVDRDCVPIQDHTSFFFKRFNAVPYMTKYIFLFVVLLSFSVLKVFSQIQHGQPPLSEVRSLLNRDKAKKKLSFGLGG